MGQWSEPEEGRMEEESSSPVVAIYSETRNMSWHEAI